MRVFLKVGVPGAREAAARSNVVAIIDALRASVTITSALVVGAVKVIPVLTVALPNATALAQVACGATVPLSTWPGSEGEIYR